MSIKVLIKREIPEKHKKEIDELLLKLRARAGQQKGYVGGETLKRVDAPDQYLVISEWAGLDDWSRWLVSAERRTYQEQIDTLTGSETKFEVYEQQ